jgi:hypothetical protein
MKKRNETRIPPKDKELKQYRDPIDCLSAFTVLRNAYGAKNVSR